MTMLRIRTAAVVLSVLFIANCATSKNSSQADSQKADDKALSGPSLYGLLSKSESGYKIASISTLYDRELPWVRLNDRKPMWNLDVEKSCTSGTWKYAKTPKCSTINNALFREFDTDLSSSIVPAIVSLGFAASSPIGDVEFNNEKYLEAYEEAISRVSYDGKVGQVAIEKILSSYSDFQNKLSREYYHYRDLQQENYSKIKLDIKVADQSGLYSGNPNFSDQVAVKSKYMSEPGKKFDIQADTPDNLVEKLNKEYQTHVSAWEKTISTFRVSCAWEKSDVNYKMNCPSDIEVEKNATETIVPIPVTIFGKDYDRVLPRKFSINDKVITIRLNNGSVKIDSASSNYLSVESISLYYNDKIFTKSQLNKEIPPLGSVDILTTSALPIDWSSLRFDNMTKKDLEKKTLNFGFAVKYKIGNTNKENTLFKTKTYSLSELVVSL